jgi:hypothetical protein
MCHYVDPRVCAPTYICSYVYVFLRACVFHLFLTYMCSYMHVFLRACVFLHYCDPIFMRSYVHVILRACVPICICSYLLVLLHAFVPKLHVFLHACVPTCMCYYMHNFICSSEHVFLPSGASMCICSLPTEDPA